MADIFVSYARTDRARVAPLVAALERHGWSVWWDPAISPGQSFDDLIAEELDKASAVVVVWTPASVASRWVRGEAREAADRAVVVPVRFENARLPIDARSLHTTDLDGWKEDAASDPFQELLAALSQLLKDRISSGAASNRGTSICVLPFLNMSGDPEQEYFSDGLSEELLNQLAQMKGLKVAARTSSFAFKGQNPDLKVVSEKLGVGHVLEGSVRKAGNRLRITAQLISCADGYHLWSNTFNRELDDVFQIQEDIARAVADALKITLRVGQSTLIPGGTRNVEAYDVFLRAQAFLRQYNPQSVQRAIALFKEAVDLDPSFALSWLHLATAYTHAMVFTPEAIETSRRLSAEAFERAKAIAPDAWTVHAAEATQLMLVSQDWVGAGEAYQRARQFAPNASLADEPPYFLVSVGRAEEAAKGYRSLARTDPLTLDAMFQYTLDCAGHHDEAQAEYRRWLTMPTDPALGEYFAFLRTMMREGRQGAKTQLRHYLALNDGYLPIHDQVLAKFDDKSAVLALIRNAFEEPFYQNPSQMTGLAHLAAHFGDDDLALACLRHAFVEKRGVTVPVIWHPLFAQVRRTEGFKQLVRDLGLHDYWRKSGRWGDFARPVGDDDFEVYR